VGCAAAGAGDGRHPRPQVRLAGGLLQEYRGWLASASAEMLLPNLGARLARCRPACGRRGVSRRPVWTGELADGRAVGSRADTGACQTARNPVLHPLPRRPAPARRSYAVRRVLFSPHSANLLLSCSYDMTVKLWDTASPQV
jgi:hypothetical protein